MATSIFTKEIKIVSIDFIHTIPGLYIILPLKQNRLKFFEKVSFLLSSILIQGTVVRAQ